MTTRELWQEILFYGEFDRVPAIHWAAWDETLKRWADEGLPEGANLNEYLDAVPIFANVGVHLDLFPAFEAETLEDTDDYRVFRDAYGVVQQDWKHKSCIPHYIDHTLKTAQDWSEFKKRLQPDPARVPETLDAHIAEIEQSDLPIVVGCASMMGWIRNWMGVVNMSYLMYDDPDCFADMVDTLAELSCWGIDQVLPRMNVKPIMGFGWEDICGKNGPLVSPGIFGRCVASGYRKMRAKLEEHGVTLLGIDTDGLVEPLVPDWLEAGVNVQFPVEIGTWKADPMALRKRFGKELRIIGGIDKLELEKGRAAIDAEVERRIPLMKDGGFVPMPDHFITPGTSLEDYEYYIDHMRALRI